MITVHHLEHSRSTRILWLLEELEQPYEMVRYARDQTMRAPASMKAVHPLGRAPVIEDDGRVIAESGAVIEYLVATYGAGRLGPVQGTAGWPAYIEWLHFGEGTAMTGIMLKLIGGSGLPDRAKAYAEESLSGAMALIESALDGHDFLVGDTLTGADIQIQYVIDFAINMGLLAARPVLQAYQARLTVREAYRRAIDKGGPVALPRRRPVAAAVGNAS